MLYNAYNSTYFYFFYENVPNLYTDHLSELMGNARFNGHLFYLNFILKYNYQNEPCFPI